MIVQKLSSHGRGLQTTMVVAYLKSMWEEEVRPSLCPTIENPDLVLQETGSSPTHSCLNYVSSGDTLRRDAMSSFF